MISERFGAAEARGTIGKGVSEKGGSSGPRPADSGQDLVALHLLVECGGIEAQLLRRPLLASVDPLERLDDDSLLDVGDELAQGDILQAASLGNGERGRGAEVLGKGRPLA